MARRGRGRKGQPNGPMGVLNVLKPAEWTSHDVVAKLRGVLGTRRVGHAGTLDPMATGVLVVCVNQATRLSDLLADGAKEYVATLQFGVETNTYDAEGEVTAERDASHLTLDAIRNVLPSFLGDIDQVPPMYSAIKKDGQPLYKLARKGITIERPARQVTIHALEILDWSPPELSLRVACSKGTYIRSLAYDLGQAVDVGAHLTALERTAVGAFALADAVSLADLVAADDWRPHLIPLRQALAFLPQRELDAQQLDDIRHGQPVRLDVGSGAATCCGLENGEVVALLAPLDDKPGLWRPTKVLVGAV